MPLKYRPGYSCFVCLDMVMIACVYLINFYCLFILRKTLELTQNTQDIHKKCLLYRFLKVLKKFVVFMHGPFWLLGQNNSHLVDCKVAQDSFFIQFIVAWGCVSLNLTITKISIQHKTFDSLFIKPITNSS